MTTVLAYVAGVLTLPALAVAVVVAPTVEVRRRLAGDVRGWTASIGWRRSSRRPHLLALQVGRVAQRGPLAVAHVAHRWLGTGPVAFRFEHVDHQLDREPTTWGWSWFVGVRVRGRFAVVVASRRAS